MVPWALLDDVGLMGVRAAARIPKAGRQLERLSPALKGIGYPLAFLGATIPAAFAPRGDMVPTLAQGFASNFPGLMIGEKLGSLLPCCLA